ncbi:MAG: C25 family cysteine peptidase, partial [Thermoanaerobaculia bacterium]
MAMKTIKLSLTHRGRLAKKYGKAGLARIDKAVKSWVAKDAERGITTLHVALDDAQAMARYRVAPVTGSVTPTKVKQAVDGLFKALSPDYLVLMGSSDVLPHFAVANPSFAPVDGDLDEEVPTDNPYACSRPFVKSKRESYLIPDRVVGRIPDLPGRGDPAVLVDYLAAAESWKPGAATAYADDLLLCCDSWKASGRECAEFLTRQAKRLLVSPPTVDGTAALRKRHATRLHMIKCHGAQLDGRFYGERANSDDDLPIALTSGSLAGRVVEGTVVGAMCCYGGLVFDPDDDAAEVAGALPIPTAYLQQGAYGFAGSTTIAWVGPEAMVCADRVIASFLRGTLRGASLGRALLEAKQDFVRFIDKQGAAPDIADEKTLLQFYLLGDPSIHLVAAAPAGGPAAAAVGVR